jgi:hypothetical protein
MAAEESTDDLLIETTRPATRVKSQDEEEVTVNPP